MSDLVEGRWEYLIVSERFRGANRLADEQERLNEYGRDGWDLVAAHSQLTAIQTGGQPEAATEGLYYFKRPSR